MEVYTKNHKIWGTMSTDAPPNGVLKFCKISFIVGCVLAVFMLFFMMNFMGFIGALLFSVFLVGLSYLILLLGKRYYRDWKQFYEEMREYEENGGETDADQSLNPSNNVSCGSPSYIFVLMIALSAFFIIGGLLSDAGFVSVIGVIILGLGVFVFKMEKLGKKAAEEEREVQVAQAEADRKSKVLAFYEVCIQENAVDLTIDVKRQKATLIANQHFKKYDLDTLMAEGQSLYEERQKAKRTAEEDAEKAAQAELVKYAGLHGREKTLVMLKEKLSEHQRELDELRARYDEYTAKAGKGYKKEKSWGLAGGIAEAIAGPAAGVAAAIDVMKQNADARDFNERKASMAADVLGRLKQKIVNKESAVKHYSELFSKAQSLLVKDDDMATCFEKLKFGKAEIEISNTGTAIVKVTVEADPFLIFDDRRANVDGSVIAHIYGGPKEVGQAIMVFPLDGIKYSRCQLTGMALFCCKPGKHYRVKFTPNDLWAIEQ